MQRSPAKARAVRSSNVSWSWSSSQADGDADVDDAGARVRGGIDATVAGIAADAVDLGSKPALAVAHERILRGQVEGRGTGPGEESRRQLVGERDRLQPQERAIFHERAIEAPGPGIVGARPAPGQLRVRVFRR